ncbi:hypothetical protein LPJ53_005527 [Coemansia erecta]|uniref:Sas10 C-terminal domain-containing protein n=1 Tax=Coemansia erecta TaxID=147472 RepID=A0A9W7XWH7_9FUNG|nr:hypothetical protein LPJ53_005527 [Coemansia erecta]
MADLQALRDETEQRLKTISTQATQVRELVDGLRARVTAGELATGKGLSFLEVKQHTLLSYLSSLSFVALLKLHGGSLKAHPAVWQLIEDRTVLEKMKPLEQRLKYQIDKLLRTAVVGPSSKPEQPSARMITTDDPEAEAPSATGNALAAMLASDAMANPTSFGPNPEALARDLRGMEEGGGGDPEDPSGLYRVAKQMPVRYEEQGARGAARREREEQRMAARASRSRLVRDLMAQYDDRPELASASGNPERTHVDGRMARLAEDTRRFEEENFRRRAVSKRERKGLRERLVELEDEFTHLNDFAGIAGLAGEGRVERAMKRGKGKRTVLERVAAAAGEGGRDSNESPAEMAKRRRRGGDDEGVERSAPRQGKFQRAKRQIASKRR